MRKINLGSISKCPQITNFDILFNLPIALLCAFPVILYCQFKSTNNGDGKCSNQTRTNMCIVSRLKCCQIRYCQKGDGF